MGGNQVMGWFNQCSCGSTAGCPRCRPALDDIYGKPYSYSDWLPKHTPKREEDGSAIPKPVYVPETEADEFRSVRTGWECPVCHKGNAPFAIKCGHC